MSVISIIFDWLKVFLYSVHYTDRWGMAATWAQMPLPTPSPNSFSQACSQCPNPFCWLFSWPLVLGSEHIREGIAHLAFPSGAFAFRVLVGALRSGRLQLLLVESHHEAGGTSLQICTSPGPPAPHFFPRNWLMVHEKTIFVYSKISARNWQHSLRNSTNAVAINLEVNTLVEYVSKYDYHFCQLYPPGSIRSHQIPAVVDTIQLVLSRPWYPGLT